MPVYLNGCDSSSLILRETNILRVFEKRVLMKIFRPKEENRRELKRWHNEVSRMPPNMIRMMNSIRMRWESIC
jgi:hypothetical protein